MRYPSPNHFTRSRSLQPGLQNGACWGDSGLPQSGHFFDLSGVFGISGRHGETGIGPQPDITADLAAELVQPSPILS